jgi:hypothetical protein
MSLCLPGNYISTTDRLNSRGRKILVPILVLVLPVGVFVFFGEEARAQQPEPQHTATTYEIVVEQMTKAAPLDTSRIEKLPVETSAGRGSPGRQARAGRPTKSRNPDRRRTCAARPQLLAWLHASGRAKALVEGGSFRTCPLFDLCFAKHRTAYEDRLLR